MRYFARFRHGLAQVQVKGWFGRSSMVGLTSLADGRRHVIIFDGKTGKLEMPSDHVLRVEMDSDDPVVIMRHPALPHRGAGDCLIGADR